MNIPRLKAGLRYVLRPVLLRMFRVRVTYKASTTAILSSGASCILVCNHVSLLDGIIVALASPVPLAFAVDTEYSRGAGGSTRLLQMLAWLGFGKIVPVDATAPFGIRSLLTELMRGGRVMVFPEGRISATGQRGGDQPGVKWLTDRSGVAVAELEIRGAEQSRLFAKSGSALWPRIRLLF
ncbi:1-acyl-sn-glycerol-3-phosphate acyltransferase [Paraburkholderia fungorum]|uniref:1-acyl-sn-glycerol-3-phosphate acyltransferase n=1 Tax=Paraburkholderia fungorum TaxID=134537 RepID=UPI0005AB372D|nr:1-acyl-sn-glycerol-3-phosphate acyltransferase [Paraburkholderia fungorum]MBB5547398.1 acyl-[acyl-carrier-protein]-phospholipid O-acyltransferase/long-chain-fatty-acid--[acyl-carrier-protein] ligase [Paraburkholderia fungorum]PNE59721.1 1-acyl-sn-glycerol-3-phosphate acyltransferase [Paraburkholderia fungorum]